VKYPREVPENLAGGMSDDELLADFSELTIGDVRACLACAANDPSVARSV
jgi:uncharacterized protein (DUF433 family)